MAALFLIVASAACLLMVSYYLRYVLSLDEENSDTIMATPDACGMPVMLPARLVGDTTAIPHTERSGLNDE
jgi:hypothetical protein